MIAPFLGCLNACLKTAPQVFVQHQRVLHSTSGSVALALVESCNTVGRDVIVKPHHEEDIFVITRGRAEAEV